MALNPIEKAIKEIVGYALDVASNYYEHVKPALAGFLSKIGVAADVIEALLDENPALALTAVVAGTIVVAILGPELAAGGSGFHGGPGRSCRRYLAGPIGRRGFQCLGFMGPQGGYYRIVKRFEFSRKYQPGHHDRRIVLQYRSWRFTPERRPI